jgi:RND family efflux transporter MFP subunit
MRRNRIRSLRIVVIAAGLLGACSPNEKRLPETRPLVAGVQTEVVHFEAARLAYQAVGTVRAAKTAVLATQLAGTVREIRVRAGDHVRCGQLLAVLDDRGAQAQVQGADAGVNEALEEEAEVDQALKAATADRQLAEVTFNRYKSLLARNSLSRQEYDAAEARYQAALANERAIEAKRQQVLARQQQARSQQSLAQTYLSYAHIISPLDGIVTAKNVDVGTVVMPGTVVLTVEDTSRYRLEASLPEEHLASTKAGDSVTVSIGQGRFNGSVAEIVPSADTTSHTFLVRIDLPSNCKCRSGDYGRASFSIGDAKRLAVPISAVIEHGELQGVFVLRPDSTVEYRLVKTGKTFGDQIEILSGLDQGEEVAVSQTDQLRDGARVEGL